MTALIKIIQREKEIRSGLIFQERTLKIARNEVFRIGNVFAILDPDLNEIYQEVEKVWLRTKPKTSRKNPYVLVPIVFYHKARNLNHFINLKSLSDNLKCKKQKFFQNFKLPYLEFQSKNRVPHTISLIRRICSKMEIPEEIRDLSVNIFETNIPKINSTTVKIAASASIGLAIIVSDLRKDISLVVLAKQVQVSTSALYGRILRVLENKKILTTKKLNDFKINLDTIQKLISKT